MSYLIFSAIFGLGLIVGSFLNVVILRLYSKEDFIRGQSKCPRCRHVLGVKDLFPVFSFLWLKGACRYCQKKISRQYPLVEFFTGLIFLLIGATTGLSGLALFQAAMACFLIIIFVYDLKYGLILDKISLPAMGLALIGGLIFQDIPWWSMLLGAALAGGLFLGQYILSKGKWIGGGDLRLGVLMGLILGWEKVLVALFLAYVLGALVAVFLLVRGNKKMGDALPFGTFLTLATLISLLYGEQIINWYFRIILW